MKKGCDFLTYVIFILCSIALFINFKNIWINLIKLLLSFAITLGGIEGILHFTSNTSEIIKNDFAARGQLTIDEQGMLSLCSETADILGKVVYHIPTVLCAILLYIMLKVLIRRSILKMPHSSEITVKLTLAFILILPFYCCVAYGLGLDNKIYNMMPIMLTLAVYISEAMMLPLAVFSILCETAYQYFSENTATKYKGIYVKS